MCWCVYGKKATGTQRKCMGNPIKVKGFKHINRHYQEIERVRIEMRNLMQKAEREIPQIDDLVQKYAHFFKDKTTENAEHKRIVLQETALWIRER